jgi:hypothetical protein
VPFQFLEKFLYDGTSNVQIFIQITPLPASERGYVTETGTMGGNKV